MEAERQAILIFKLDNARFGLDATKVLESVWLPELVPIEEAPPWVVGMFNLRGRIVPVTDLNLRFGHPAKPLTLSDQVVVLSSDNETLGLIVSEVLEVVELLPDAIKPSPDFKSTNRGVDHLAAGIASIADDLVTLIDISKLTKPAGTLTVYEASETTAWPNHLASETDAEGRALLHTRAMALRQSISEEDVPLLGLAVIEMSGEYFGLELTAVQEFCDITQLRPIPCCPPHILGAMSLRGKLLTLIDPRRALNLPLSSLRRKAVIALTSPELNADLGGQLVGIAVDEVHDVVYLRSKELRKPPSALVAQCEAEITGTAPYNGKTMTILNLPALLAREEWIVDENV